VRGLRSWVPAMRVARRETVRGRGRSILVLVMIALPVLGVTAADVVIQTGEITGAEALERRLGTADALLQVEPGIEEVEQLPDPLRDGWGGGGARPGDDTPDLNDLTTALGRELRAVELRQGSVRVETDAGVAFVEAFEADLTDDLTDGLYRVEEGRVPVGPGEVVVNGALADRGISLGDDLAVRNGPTLEVVGIAEHTTYRGHPVAVSTVGGFDMRDHGSRQWLVDAGGDVTWDDVLALNAVGGVVTSRAVLLDPPPRSEITSDMYPTGGGISDDQVAVVALIVVMALMEVVLLAGPAFAVIARRMQRSLALMAAGGATPQQARRVVLATGLVLGTLGSALGVGLGLLLAWLSLPVVQRFSDSYLGPYDVPWLHLAGIAVFGLLSAFLAAVVPAWIASRQDVVAVLAGRRGEGRPSVRSPILGVVLLAAGVGVSVWGALEQVPFSIAVASVVTVLGMVLLVPVVVQLVSQLARHLPLPTRYAVRDAARHRTRTVPAVAAVAATVAGVVALGIAASSDDEQSEATYTQRLEMGQGSLTTYGRQQDWEAYEAAARRFVPDAQVVPVIGVPDAGRRWTDVNFRLGGSEPPLSMWSSWLGTSVPVTADGSLPPGVMGLSEAEQGAAEAVLVEGGVLVFTDRGAEGDEVLVRTRGYRPGPDERTEATLPAYVVPITGREATVPGVLSAAAADELGVDYRTVGLVVDGTTITEEQETDVSEALAAIGENLSFYVERGYQADDDYVIILLVLGALGALLMLGGTLTATFLSLSDARPDLATLAAVGASPRTRRRVAASYALVIGLLGALLGTLVGFVPGIAATYPLTGSDWVQDVDPSLPTHFLDVPWLLIGSLVIALPLLTAAVVGVTTRSRLPLVARID
jgi:putative ABC transport system permease protein